MTWVFQFFSCESLSNGNKRSFKFICNIVLIRLYYIIPISQRISFDFLNVFVMPFTIFHRFSISLFILIMSRFHNKFLHFIPVVLILLFPFRIIKDFICIIYRFLTICYPWGYFVFFYCF